MVISICFIFSLNLSLHIDYYKDLGYDREQGQGKFGATQRKPDPLVYHRCSTLL